ncbi:MAG: DUF427 domain-containing protein [Pseudomonadota bacterium]
MNNSIPILPVSAQIQTARDKWRYTGAQRPDFAEATSAGSISVWDFPRPPVIHKVPVTLRIAFKAREIALTDQGLCVYETASAPTYYFPPEDVDLSALAFGEMSSICEWKGVAQTITVAGQPGAGWRYVRMFEEFATLFHYIAFYPTRLECYVGDERASGQPGGFYGGWVTQSLRGPIKGEPGSSDW